MTYAFQIRHLFYCSYADKNRIHDVKQRAAQAGIVPSGKAHARKH